MRKKKEVSLSTILVVCFAILITLVGVTQYRKATSQDVNYTERVTQDSYDCFDFTGKWSARIVKTNEKPQGGYELNCNPIREKSGWYQGYHFYWEANHYDNQDVSFLAWRIEDDSIRFFFDKIPYTELDWERLQEISRVYYIKNKNTLVKNNGAVVLKRRRKTVFLKSND